MLSTIAVLAMLHGSRWVCVCTQCVSVWIQAGTQHCAGPTEAKLTGTLVGRDGSESHHKACSDLSPPVREA